MKKSTLIVIAGPTAVGKTSLAIKIAKHYNTDIISADSRQFYKEMQIGTAVPSSEELQSVKHHFIQSHSVSSPISAGEYEKITLALLETLFVKNNVVVLTGGSGLFIDALVNGIDTSLPPADFQVRKDLENQLQEKGLEWLQEKLKEKDPKYYLEVDLKNPRRIIRALEVCKTTGKPYSELRKNEIKDRDFNTISICLNLEREVLYSRINQRVDNMMSDGLLKEVESLVNFKHLPSLKTVGYTELFDFLENKHILERAIELIKQNTRRYAKRQITWFKRNHKYYWFSPNEIDKIITKIDLIKNN